MARTKTYYDRNEEKLNGCFFTTDPAIDEYSFFGIESEYFSYGKTVDTENCFIPVEDGAPCNEAIEEAREAGVALFVDVFKKGKFQESICLYDPCYE